MFEYIVMQMRKLNCEKAYYRVTYLLVLRLTCLSLLATQHSDCKESRSGD